MRNKKSTAIKILEQLATEAAHKKNPKLPIEWLAPRTFNDYSANALTKCVIEYIKLKGYQAERISTTGRFIKNEKVVSDVLGRNRVIGNNKYIPGTGTKGSADIPGTGTKGSADISATIYGRSVKIEIKYGKDRQSEYQKSYQADVERAGGIYLIVRTFQDFFNWYQDFINKLA